MLPAIVTSYIEAYNRRDVAELLSCMVDDVTFENVSNAGGSLALKGKDALEQLAPQAVTTFSSRLMVVRRSVVAGDEVALKIDWSGTPSLDLPGMAAGQPVSLRGATFISLRDGRISRIVDLS